MLIHVVNPNTTSLMTVKIGKAAKAAAGTDVEIMVSQATMGPVSIEGYYDEAFAVPGMLARIAEAEAKGAAGHVIGCFDDTGLDAARCIAKAPVIGIGEAAFHAASLVAGKFSVITTLGRSIPAIELNLLRYGLASRCNKVRAAEVPVLALEDPQSDAYIKITAEIVLALQEDACEAIVLGCAGMADLARDLSAKHGVPIIDGVAVSVGFIQMLHQAGIKTSKRGGYASPSPKKYTGEFSRFAPS